MFQTWCFSDVGTISVVHIDVIKSWVGMEEGKAGRMFLLVIVLWDGP